MVADLPQGWEHAQIGFLCNLINGKAFKPADWSNRGLPIVRIQNLNNPDAPYNYYTGEIKDKFLIDNNQLLFAWSGTPGTSFGAHIWTGGKAVLNQHIFKVEFNEMYVDRDFFRYAINQKLQELIDKAHGGVGLRHVTKGKFEETEITLPPLAEQRRIVAKLNALFARTRQAREELSHIPALIEQYKQAVLAAAFSGELTKQWREDKDLPEPQTGRLNDLCESIADGDHQAPPRVESGIPFITISAMNSGTIYLEKATRFVPREYYEGLKPSRRPRKGDVLYSVTGSIAIPALVRTNKEFVFQRHIAILRPDSDKLDEHYLSYALASPETLSQAYDVATGTAQLTIPLSGLRNFIILYPSLQEQREIANRIVETFRWLDNVLNAVTASTNLLDNLEQATLSKAFRGELLPQDPNDEPASVLLERIRDEQPETNQRKLI